MAKMNAGVFPLSRDKLFRYLAVASIVIVLAVVLAACEAGSTTSETAAATTPTPWPTLEPVLSPQPTPMPDATTEAGPRLLDQFRVDVQEDAVSVFQIEGQIDQPVRIEAIVLSGNIDPYITMSNSVGDRLAYADSGQVGEPEVIGQFQFPGDGFYELGVAAPAGSGEVGISIYALDPANLEGGGVFGSMNEELRGTMDHPSTYHTFRLPVERGIRFNLSAQALTEGLDLVLELYSPDGVLLAARDDNVGVDPYLWNFMPSQSGLYTIVLSNYDEGVGDYLLTVSQADEDTPAAMGTRTELTLSANPRSSSWLTFDSRALDAVRVEARPISPGMDLSIALYDSYGNRLAAADQFGLGEPEQLTTVQVPYDGQYYVEFLTLGEGGQIEYYIRAIRQSEIELGGKRISPSRFAHEGEIVGPGTSYTYLFDAEAGDLIGADAHGTDSSGLDLGFDLYAPDGTRLISLDDVVGVDPVIDRIELPQTGQYALVLWNFGDTTGLYDLYVTNPEAPATPPGPALTLTPPDEQ
jgi:hypothetical protein